jgi:hypothetical protein
VGDRLFYLRVGGGRISAEIGVMAAMATSDAQKRAMKNYAETEKGKEARSRAIDNYLATDEGKEKLAEAKKRYESKSETKAKKAKWARERYQRLKKEKQEAAKSD